MVHACTQRVVHRVSVGVLAAALLAACGGGEVLAILQIVTPLAGQWSAGNNESIGFQTPVPAVQVTRSQGEVTGSVFSGAGVCGDTTGNGVPVVGRVDNGNATLRLAGAQADCIRGKFSSLVQFDAEAIDAIPARSYFNSRVDVQMQTGLWVSENGQLTLKFEGPSSVDNNSSDTGNVTGCDVSSPTAKVRFSDATMFGFNTSNQARPFINELRNSTGNAMMFSAVVFVDGGTITLRTPTDQSITLTRKPDPGKTKCS